MSSLIARLLGIDSASKFKLLGTQQDIKGLRELIQIIESVPSGRQMLKDVLASGRLPKISFVPGFQDNKNANGRFHWGSNSIEIVKIDTNLPEMSERARLQSKIMMAVVLAHELQHCIDVPRNRKLNNLASNVNEAVLSTALGEMNAYLHEEQVNTELCKKHNLFPKIYVYHHPQDAEGQFRIAKSPNDPLYVKYKGKELVQETGAISSQPRTKVMKRALSGKIPKIKRYMDQERKWWMSEMKSFGSTNSKVEFQNGVRDYLKDMHASLNYGEAMFCVTQSMKLLPFRQGKRLK